MQANSPIRMHQLKGQAVRAQLAPPAACNDDDKGGEGEGGGEGGGRKRRGDDERQRQAARRKSKASGSKSNSSGSGLDDRAASPHAPQAAPATPPRPPAVPRTAPARSRKGGPVPQGGAHTTCSPARKWPTTATCDHTGQRAGKADFSSARRGSDPPHVGPLRLPAADIGDTPISGDNPISGIPQYRGITRCVFTPKSGDTPIPVCTPSSPWLPFGLLNKMCLLEIGISNQNPS